MFINACKQHLLAFMRQLLIAVKAAEINFKAVQRIIGDLINFVTVETNNRDVMTREGLPHRSRQILMREQFLFDIFLRCVGVPFERTDLFQAEDIRGGNPSLHRVCSLFMRLAWHVLRSNSLNRVYAARFVRELQSRLGFEIQAARTLTEVFTDSDQLLDSIDDAMVAQFIDLIRRPGGRQDLFVQFLIHLCHSKGKAVRTNQWKICSMLVERAPELLIQLSKAGSPPQVMVHGDPQFFPRFKNTANFELARWLAKTDTRTRKYFEKSIELLGNLGKGRNSPNMQKLQSL
jgi:hypothetical protein